MQETETQERATRIVDFKIPLPWLLSGLIACLWSLISMWFGIQQLVGTVNDLQITVKSGNTSVSVLSSQLELVKFRTGALEADLQRLSASVQQQQKERK